MQLCDNVEKFRLQSKFLKDLPEPFSAHSIDRFSEVVERGVEPLVLLAPFLLKLVENRKSAPVDSKATPALRAELVSNGTVILYSINFARISPVIKSKGIQR